MPRKKDGLEFAGTVEQRLDRIEIKIDRLMLNTRTKPPKDDESDEPPDLLVIVRLWGPKAKGHGHNGFFGGWIVQDDQEGDHKPYWTHNIGDARLFDSHGDAEYVLGNIAANVGQSKKRFKVEPHAKYDDRDDDSDEDGDDV